MYVKLYEVYIWILVLGSRGKCKRAIHVNKILKKKKKKKKRMLKLASSVGMDAESHIGRVTNMAIYIW